MKIKTAIFMSALALTPMLAPAKAEAGYGERYCREYNRSVHIGGRLESAYGTACMQPDGSWVVVSFDGNDNLYPDIQRASYRGDGRIIYVDRRPNYWYQPYRRPVNVFSFSWDNDDHDRRNPRRRNWDRDRHDRDDHHGRGRGHDRDHHDRDRGRNR